MIRSIFYSRLMRLSEWNDTEYGIDVCMEKPFQLHHFCSVPPFYEGWQRTAELCAEKTKRKIVYNNRFLFCCENRRRKNIAKGLLLTIGDTIFNIVYSLSFDDQNLNEFYCQSHCSNGLCGIGLVGVVPYGTGNAIPIESEKQIFKPIFIRFHFDSTITVRQCWFLFCVCVCVPNRIWHVT